MNFGELSFNMFEKQSMERLKGVSIHTNGNTFISDEAYTSIFGSASHVLIHYNIEGVVGLQAINEDHPEVENAYKITLNNTEGTKDKRPTFKMGTMMKELGWADRITESLRVDELPVVENEGRNLIILDLREHLKEKPAAEEVGA